MIPVSRTGSPYSLTDALGEFAGNTRDTDTGALNQSLNTLSATIERVAPQLGPTFEGISRISKALNDAMPRCPDCSRVPPTSPASLSQRSQQVNALILNGNELLGVLQDRQYAIVTLLANTSALSQQLSGLVADNERTSRPRWRSSTR